MSAGTVPNKRTFHPSMDMTREEQERRAAQIASVQAAQRVKAAALLASLNGNFQDIAEALDLPYEVTA